MKNREEFDLLGGELPPPFDEASARDVATAIHAVLVDVGLTPQKQFGKSAVPCWA